MASVGVGFDLGRPTEVSDHPFRHVCFEEAAGLTAAEVARLLEVFPGEGVLAGSHRTAGGEKTYSVRTTTVYDGGRWTAVLDELHPLWQGFMRRLVESDYRHRLAALLGLPAGPVELEVRLAEYPRGGWMSRHTDRPEKLFSQNIYLCPGWRPDWGGGLALYTDEHTPDPVAVFVPGAGNSLAFARTDRSWHEVLPVSPLAPAPRRTVLVHGYREVPEHKRSEGRTGG
jgi:Rps23 Pro-64 3,4-dihydroxylase Tpa1-like proline 4-hydroxylase